MSGVDCDLLVVGLGPVGNVLAGLARLHGLSVIAIDKALEPYPLPRAAVFDHEVMRIFQMLDLAEEIGAICRVPQRYEFINGKGELLLEFDLGAMANDSGWAESYALHQPAVEAALGRRIVDLGVDVRRSIALTGLSQTAETVVADISGTDGNGHITARLVVGCDGASSIVRKLTGISCFDYGFDEPWLVLDTIAKAPDVLPMTLRQVCDPRRPFTYMPMSNGRFRWEFMMLPGEDPAAVLADEHVATLIRPWCNPENIEVERKTVYRFHALVAREWRQGRVLIAGDAAHQMPPFAGQGMCSGIRDANNLAWKLAMVISDGADIGVLDSYQAEREPHVRSIIETAIAMGQTVCILDESVAAARDAGMIAQRQSGTQNISIRHPDLAGGFLTSTPGAGALFRQAVEGDRRFDALLDVRPTLVGYDLPAAPSSIRALDLNSPGPAPFVASIEQWLGRFGLAQRTAVLVRPDRHVFGTGDPVDLLAAWKAKLIQSVSAQRAVIAVDEAGSVIALEA